jgi:hypothetical protein
MSLTSSSTLVEVQAAYDDNASYAEDGDVAKAKAFITACRILLRRMPKESGTREQHFKMNPELIQKEMDAAQQFVAANDTTSGGCIEQWAEGDPFGLSKFPGLAVQRGHRGARSPRTNDSTQTISCDVLKHPDRSWKICARTIPRRSRAKRAVRSGLFGSADSHVCFGHGVHADARIFARHGSQ